MSYLKRMHEMNEDALRKHQDSYVEQDYNENPFSSTIQYLLDNGYKLDSVWEFHWNKVEFYKKEHFFVQLHYDKTFVQKIVTYNELTGEEIEYDYRSKIIHIY